MPEVKYDIALDSEGKYVSILNAEKGLKYYCPECKGEFIVRKGKIRAWHFAHKGGIPPSCSGESAKHALMKHKLYYLLSNTGKLYVVYHCERCGSYHYRDIKVNYVRIEEEIGSVRPDVSVIYKANKKLAIEVVHRNPLDVEKEGVFKREDISFLEVWCEDNSRFLEEVVEIKIPVFVPQDGYSLVHELVQEIGDNRALLFYRKCRLLDRECLLDVLKSRNFRIIDNMNIKSWIKKVRAKGKCGTIFNVERENGVIFAKTKEQGSVVLAPNVYQGDCVWGVPSYMLTRRDSLSEPSVEWAIFVGKMYGLLVFSEELFEDFDELIDEVFNYANNTKMNTLLPFLGIDSPSEYEFELGAFKQILESVSEFYGCYTVSAQRKFIKPKNKHKRPKENSIIETIILKTLGELDRPTTAYELSIMTKIPIWDVLIALNKLVSSGEVCQIKGYFSIKK
ncbi:hypothetical protein Asulf_01405 [Archaeoglobus sulfaticallidus PM70-1]|uniref:Competence protein CoiA-like N-terminal domain-containing protein n=1 Tax=Archaeoglobus sulfaticallidus PM70-1 TaxID=387631 RepID=N0BGH0_9EURY|nr:competence protein CoiA family protein [Archaeoglobus sulfaticallidus]AGK61392.1 hypothetical protein Asulf_01405 [Archaeoglobus sulfaticallidus PM70-1]